MNSRRSSVRSARHDARLCTRPRRERGIALVTVAWFLALMTLLAGTALGIARISSKLTVNRLAFANAEAAADSAIRRAILSLIDEDPHRRWPVGGEPTSFKFHGASATVCATDESGRVDLNGADVALLAAVLAAQGVGEEGALGIAARLIDWRDADDTVTDSGGAERLEYRARGLGYGPRNGPFESVDEIALILGMPSELIPKSAPLFTVYTGQSAVNEAAASPDVLAVLKWADSRQWRGRRWLSATAAVPAEPGRSTAGRVVRVTAELSRTAARVDVRREAVVRLTGNARDPMLVYSWATIFPTAVNSEAATAH